MGYVVPWPVAEDEGSLGEEMATQGRAACPPGLWLKTKTASKGESYARVGCVHPWPLAEHECIYEDEDVDDDDGEIDHSFFIGRRNIDRDTERKRDGKTRTQRQ